MFADTCHQTTILGLYTYFISFFETQGRRTHVVVVATEASSTDSLLISCGGLRIVQEERQQHCGCTQGEKHLYDLILVFFSMLLLVCCWFVVVVVF